LTRSEGLRLAATFVVGLVIGGGIGFGVASQRADVSAGSAAAPSGGQAERMRADPVDPRAPVIRVSLNGAGARHAEARLERTGRDPARLLAQPRYGQRSHVHRHLRPIRWW
jgi:hypothetical protein